MSKRFFLLLTLLASLPARALDVPAPPVPAAPALEQPEIPDDGVRVSIIGYHDLAENLPETAMRMHATKFRKQMEVIRQLGLQVITLEQFTAWKKHGTPIPAKSILITFDDGWKSTYTDAFPVLKELGYPFTVFLYKNYVDIGGKSLSTAMIQEMLAHGASIGSHSVTHPYPITVKKYRKKGPAAYDMFLRKEMGESKTYLESKFPVKVTSYAYPGGFYTEEMLPLGEAFHYDFMFTVLPGKIKRSLPNETLPRNIILGNYDKLFDIATTFRESSGELAQVGEASPLAPESPYPVRPEAGAIVNTRLPDISADLSAVTDLDPATVSMKVAGFGEVPATFDAATGKIAWKVNRRLRQPTCAVLVSWKDTAGKTVEPPLRWSFKIDLESAYLPDSQ